LPADKGRYGSFAVLQKQNHEIIQKILEPDANPPHSLEFSYDDQILHKLRGLYHSCLDETTLDSIGMEPLVQFVRTLRKLYRGKSTDIGFFSGDDSEKNSHGLTAALSFLHSRGLLDFGSFSVSLD
jgi:endothelin-converting enzyme